MTKGARMTKRDLRSEDAVSELVDFSIILSIMLLAAAIIMVAGVPLIKSTQDKQHSENIVQSYQVLAPNINKVVKGISPSQSVELKMYGGYISVTSTSYMDVSMKTWNSSSASYETESFGKHIGTIESRYRDTFIAYENTGVLVRYNWGRPVTRLEPFFTYSDGVLLIPCSSLSGNSFLSGSGLVSVTANGGRRTIESYHNVSQVNITISSDYYEGWADYLNGTMGMSILEDEGNSTVTASKMYGQNIDVYIIEAPMDIVIR